MITDEMIRDELTAAAATVPALEPAPVQAVMRRGRRRRLIQRTAVGAGAAALLAMSVATTVALRSGDEMAAPETTAAATSVVTTEASEVVTTTSPAEPTTTTSAAEGPTTTAAEIGDVLGLGVPELEVGTPLPGFTDPPVYSGTAAPALSIDPGDLGNEEPLILANPDSADITALPGPSLYVGELADAAAFVSEGTTAGEVCLWVGGTPRLCDRSGVFELAEVAGSPRFAGWIGVPTGTAAVVFTRGDEPVGWQSPVGGVVVIPITAADISGLVAIDEAGRELNRLALPDGLGAASEVVVTTTTTP